MNRIIKPFLENHVKSFELDCEESKQFEHFINYLAVRNYLSRSFDPSDISLGKGEVGIDGVAIIVRDTLITGFEQIKDLFTTQGDISVSIVFVQSKTSESLDMSSVSHFFTTVRDFINDGNINVNEKASELHKICSYIFSNPTILSKNPDCHLFFAFTGRNNNGDLQNSIISQQIEELKKTSLFDDVTFSFYDADKIVAICRSMKNSIKKSIEMLDCAILPKIDNVSEAYIGVAKCSDYIKFITNDDGAIIANLFDDNVRYFQGQNTVNAEIQSTLREGNQQQEFSILNNGVTIVAKEMRRTGNSFTLSNFQVINGCQTSFVLFENRGRLIDDACLVVKLISTDNKDITDRIVKTTNRQTPVLNEAFETLRDYHKRLEIVYASYPIEFRLYYERRSKQYDSSEVLKSRIISFPLQTAAYVAIFLGEPHSTHRYYGELLKSYNKRIYQDDDIPEQYCMASMVLYLVDKQLHDFDHYESFKKYRFHISFMVRYLASEAKLPLSHAKAMKKYCDELF